jgi:hypothetical protein
MGGFPTPSVNGGMALILVMADHLLNHGRLEYPHLPDVKKCFLLHPGAAPKHGTSIS